MENDLLQVPEEYKGELVNVFLDHLIGVPVQGPGGQVVQMPTYICIEKATFKSQTPSSITFNTTAEGIYGPPCEMTIPKRKVTGVGLISGGRVALAPPGSRVPSPPNGRVSL